MVSSLSQTWDPNLTDVSDSYGWRGKLENAMETLEA
jgi:hypothetical protein